jgi:hypothetical protein
LNANLAFSKRLFVVSLTAKRVRRRQLRYQLPPAPMVEMVDAPPIPQSVCLDRQWLMLLEAGLPPLHPARFAWRRQDQSEDQLPHRHAVAISLSPTGLKVSQRAPPEPDAQWSQTAGVVSVIRDASVELMVAMQAMPVQTGD